MTTSSPITKIRKCINHSWHTRRCWGGGGGGGGAAPPRNKFEGADHLSPPPQIFVSKVGLYLEKMSLNHTVLPIEDLMQEFIDRSTVRLNMFRIHRYNEAFVY